MLHGKSWPKKIPQKHVTPVVGKVGPVKVIPPLPPSPPLSAHFFPFKRISYFHSNRIGRHLSQEVKSLNILSEKSSAKSSKTYLLTKARSLCANSIGRIKRMDQGWKIAD
jgi:hypothetical protein